MVWGGPRWLTGLSPVLFQFRKWNLRWVSSNKKNPICNVMPLAKIKFKDDCILAYVLFLYVWSLALWYAGVTWLP